MDTPTTSGASSTRPKRYTSAQVRELFDSLLSEDNLNDDVSDCEVEIDYDDDSWDNDYSPPTLSTTNSHSKSKTRSTLLCCLGPSAISESSNSDSSDEEFQTRTSSKGNKRDLK